MKTARERNRVLAAAHKNLADYAKKTNTQSLGVHLVDGKRLMGRVLVGGFQVWIVRFDAEGKVDLTA